MLVIGESYVELQAEIHTAIVVETWEMTQLPIIPGYFVVAPVATATNSISDFTFSF